MPFGAAAGAAVGSAAGPAGTAVGAIIGLIATLAPLIIKVSKGCGQTCIVATQYSESWQHLYEDIVTRYWALPEPRPRSIQGRVLVALRQGQETLVRACGEVPGPAGSNCVYWNLEANKGKVKADWCQQGNPNSPACSVSRWPQACEYVNSLKLPRGYGCDFWTSVYDPIANDPHTYDDNAVTIPIVDETGNVLETPITIGSTQISIWAFLLCGLALVLILMEVD